VSDSARLSTEQVLVAAQMGRTPREPWRVGSRCGFGFPSAIISPSVLAEGTPFPTFAWLTCPWLVEQVGELESAGETDRWSRCAAEQPALADALRATDDRLRQARAAEGGGHDACSSTGIAGQRDPLAVKCLHAHVALQLVGLADPIGTEVLAAIGSRCSDERCVAIRGRVGGGGQK